MADVTVAAGEIGTDLITLVADTIYEVAFSEDITSIEVISDGAAAIWWTCDGTDPETGVGWYMPAQPSIDEREPNTGSLTVVKLVSAGTPTVRVQRA